jgi:hypothetical protein
MLGIRYGTSGYSGASGQSGYSGTLGESGYSGTAGQSGYSGYASDHSKLNNLDYDNAGHVGFQKQMIWEPAYGAYLIEKL